MWEVTRAVGMGAGFLYSPGQVCGFSLLMGGESLAAPRSPVHPRGLVWAKEDMLTHPGLSTSRTFELFCR